MRKNNLVRSITLIAVPVLLLVAMMLMVSGCKKEPVVPPPECAVDSDCPGGRACSGGKCIVKATPPPRPECTTNEECADGKICVGEKCKYECQYDSDCSAGQVCEGFRCIEPACEVETVRFDFNEYYLTSESESTLRANAECIKKKKVAKVVVEGNCDERGTDEYNLSLGEKRAQAVRTFLIDLGVAREIIKTISFGEERPIDSGHDEDAWTKNRRCETVID